MCIWYGIVCPQWGYKEPTRAAWQKCAVPHYVRKSNASISLHASVWLCPFSCFVKSIKKLQLYIPLWFERTVREWSWGWSTWASGLFNLKRSCGCTCVHLPSTYVSIYIEKIVKQLHTVGCFFHKNSLEFFCRSRSSLELACYHNLVGAHTFPLPRRILHKRNQCHDDIMTVQHSGLHHPWS
jgi:hypothetical protein